MTDEGVRSLVDHVRTAINRHDLQAFLECFDETYEASSRSRRSGPSRVATAFAGTGQ